MLKDVVLGPDGMLLKQARLSLLSDSTAADLSPMECWISFFAGAVSSGMLLFIIWLVFSYTRPSAQDPLVDEKEGN